MTQARPCWFILPLLSLLGSWQLVAASDAISAAAKSNPSQPPPMAELDQFNYAIGTQTFSPAYQFTRHPRLVETAEAIREMGATVIKFELSQRYARRNGNISQSNPAIDSLTKLARDEPSHRKVLDMPFAYFVMWAHTFSGGDAEWRRGFDSQAQAAEYREMYELVVYLLQTYNGSGKTFYLGHWEGDGWMRGSVAPENDAKVTPERVQRMVDWLNTRQRAVDDAKRNTPHAGVEVWHYTEVNHVKLAMQGRKAVVNEVLPKTKVDFVSYSSYDTARNSDELKAALSFIESKLPPKAGISGKRVFIGEYGFPSIRWAPAEQEALSRQVMRAGLEWGCPFILYWELYNNEVDENGKQRGFWLIDNQGTKQPVYFTHQGLNRWGRQYVAEFTRTNHHAPSFDEYRKAAVAILNQLPGAPRH